jgi:hypothetical protein
MRKPPEPAVTLTCEICSRVFDRYPSQASGTRNFCGTPCYRLGRRKRVMQTCLNCGEHFETYPANVARGNALTCGVPCKSAYLRKSLDARLWATVVRQDGPLACWNRPGGGTNYSTISTGGERRSTVGAHIAAWFLATGRWPVEGEFICHTCDDRTCVRNDDTGAYAVNGFKYERHGHLWLGDAAANSADKVAKGRQTKGLDIAGAKVPDCVVLDIRRRFAAGGVTQTALAAEVGLSFQHVSDIIRRKRRASI